jgi:hypothetical protein
MSMAVGRHHGSTAMQDRAGLPGMGRAQWSRRTVQLYSRSRRITMRIGIGLGTLVVIILVIVFLF